MKGNQKAPYVPGGSEQRFIEKGIHGMRKDNEREIARGTLANVIRETRARVQAEQPDASSAEIEADIQKRLDHGMKPHKPASYLANAVPEENLVSAKDLAKSQRKNGRRSRKR